ncbi:MAG: hypothetical protein ACI9QL_002290 [Candidatus Omnitrophota bacterium]|jgi:hypothetical protein
MLYRPCIHVYTAEWKEHFPVKLRHPNGFISKPFGINKLSISCFRLFHKPHMVRELAMPPTLPNPA